MKTSLFVVCVLAFVLSTNWASAQSVSGQNPAMFINRNNGYQAGIGKLPVESDDLLGRLELRGWVSNGFYHPGAQLRSTITGTVNLDGFAADLQFSTSFPDLTTRMTITADGRVGIGTEVPDFDLHTVGNTHTSGDFYGRIHFDDNQATDDAPDSYIDEAYFELKQRTVLGLPAGPGMHGGLMSIAPGGGSLDHQLFFAEDGVFTRRWDGGAASWAGSSWYKILTSEDINGTPNRVAKFATPSSLGDSQLWDDGSQVGIGTDAPTAGYLLDVNGTSRVNGDLAIEQELSVIGDATLQQQLSVDGDATMAGELTVVGNTELQSNADITGVLQVSDDADLLQDLTVGQNMSAGGSLEVAGTSHLDGVVSIGTTATPGSHELYVGGSIIAEEVVVKLQTNWPDYVFDSNRPKPDIKAWARYIEEHQHLPGMPSAAEMEAKDGVPLGQTQQLLLEKIEELTLILIQQQAEIDALKAQLEE